MTDDIGTRKNLLIILSDQLRRDRLSIYGDPNIQTPHIDRLAREGVRFRNACSTYPICVPFRFTLMTGEYAHSRSVPGIEWRMSPSERTLADELNEGGYHTVYVGKWHLYGGHALLPEMPALKSNRQGVPREHQGRWQKWMGFELRNGPFDTCYNEDGDLTPKRIDGYQTDGLFDLAMEYLKERPDPYRNKPWACIVSVEPPHFPMEAPKDLEDKWLANDLVDPPNHLKQPSWAPRARLRQQGPPEAEVVRKHKQLYYAMVENLDRNVGRMLGFLESESLLDDTIICFISDHGEMQGAHGESPSIKDHPFEESVGIPFIVRHPGLLDRAGTELTAPTATEDFFPTFLGLIGLQPKNRLHGMDLSPYIRGEVEGLDRPGVLLEFVHDLRAGHIYHAEYWRAFRTERYLYAVLGGAKEGGTPWLLFDLAEDPWEMNNLVYDPGSKDLGQRLHGFLRDRLVETGDHYVLAPAWGYAGLNLWSDGG